MTDRPWPRIGVLLAIAVLLLVGCRMPGGQSPPMRYWLLEPVPGNAADVDTRLRVGVGPFVFPGYLKRTQYVERIGERQLKVAPLDRWGAPLDRAFGDVAAQNLGVQAPGVAAFEYRSRRPVDLDYHLAGTVARFEVQDATTARLEVGWTLARSEDGQIVRRAQGMYEEALTDSGVDAGVAALSAALARWSTDVAAALAELEVSP